MKRGLNWLLIFCLFISLIPFTAHAETGSVTPFSRPLQVKESDATKSQVTYTVDLPTDAAEIDLTSIKLEKGLTLVGKPEVNMSKRQLIFTVKGKEEKASSYKVAGAMNTRGELFQANPGNAVCRYSDGMKWQINSRNSTDFNPTLKDYFSAKNSKVPSDPPVSTMSYVITNSERTLSVNGTYFFKYKLDRDGRPVIDQDNPIDRSLIDPNSLQVPKGSAFAIKTTTKTKEIIYPNKYDPKNPNIGVRYLMDSEYFSEMYTNPIKTYNFITGEAGCWMYPVNYEYFIVADTIPSTTYKYWGNISFNYVTHGKATLVGKLTADPNSVQYKGEDLIIDLILEGEVVGLDKPGALNQYKLFVRLEDGTMISDPKGDIIAANEKTTVKKTYKYTINKSRLSNTNVKELTQQFSARVQGSYKPSSYYTGTLDSGLLNAATYVYKQAPVPPPEPTTGPKKQPPVAVINGDTEVKLGDYTSFNGYESYDTDGTIESYRWVMPGAKDVSVTQDKYDATYSDVTTWYDKLGAQKVTLYVKDNDGLQHGTHHSLVVVEPTVEAAIQQSGTLKENRKVTFKESSDSPAKYPVIAAKTTWKIESLYGDIPASEIKYSGSLTGKKEFDVLFKKAGEYLVTLTVENTAGYKDTVQRAVTIKPDEVPYTNFTFQEKIYRDPVKGNLATFEFTDRSYSTDGDPITTRNWYVIFDANNDGVYNEAKVLFQSGNETNVVYESKHVGKYRFFLEVQEEFGQPTIDAFVTANDRRKSNTWE